MPPQILSVGVLAGMMLLFIWGKLRYDLIAVMRWRWEPVVLWTWPGH